MTGILGVLVPVVVITAAEGGNVVLFESYNVVDLKVVAPLRIFVI